MQIIITDLHESAHMYNAEGVFFFLCSAAEISWTVILVNAPSNLTY